MVYRFAVKTYRLPLRTPLRTAHGVWAVREGLIIRLETATGAVSFGEVAPLPQFATETLAESLERCLGFGDNTDDAALDAVPARFGCVRFALAAARRPDVFPDPTKRLPITALLPAGRAALEILPGKLEQGFLSFKWKVGVNRPEEELGVLDDLLGLLPAYTRLRLDANGAWDRRAAEKWLARCTERPIEFVEQPAAPEDVDTLLGLAADYPVTLALDESVTGLVAAREWQGRGWRGVFVIKPALAGPLDELAAWAKASQADLVFSSAIETALGRAAILRFVLAHDLTKRALGFGVGEIFGDRLWDGPITGPLIDAGWCTTLDAEVLWNALN
jgi:O-succinylbenzoate synthase